MGAFLGAEVTSTQVASPQIESSPEPEPFDLEQYVESVQYVKDSTNYSYATIPSKYSHPQYESAIGDAIDDICNIACDDPSKLSQTQLRLLSKCKETRDCVVRHIQDKNKITQHKHESYPSIFPAP
eukprot:850291_1